jgi:1-acyl-sn-glycerol-3-phosphate acyltransferase
MTEPAQSPRPEPERERPVDDAGDGDGKGIYWVLKNVVVGPPVKRIFRPKVEGGENIPDIGPAIIASNHLSYADWIFMPLVLRRRITFVAKSDYFTGAGIKGRFQRGFFKGTGQVPIDRSGGSASEGAIKAGLKVLERGDLFGIYPEGTRSHDGKLYKGRTGVARLALEARVPVIPVGVIGTDVVAPPGKVVASLASPTIKFGEPLDFSRYEGMEGDRLILRAVTDEIMYRIMELSGQEYVDMYATKAKSLEGRATTGAPKKVRKSDT